MKKILMLSLFAFLLLASCENEKPLYVDSGQQTTKPHKRINLNTETNSGRDNDFEFINFEIEGCEYFALLRFRQMGITHKGNCKNPIHKRN